MKYYFSQLISEISLKLQGLRAQEYVNTPSERNVAGLRNFHTAGGVILANFFVAPPQRTLRHAVVVAPRNSLQNSRLQLQKNSI
jgi:hypothetical protein